MAGQQKVLQKDKIIIKLEKGKVVNKTFSFPLSSYRLSLNLAELLPYFDILFIFNESEESTSWPATYVLS